MNGEVNVIAEAERHVLGAVMREPAALRDVQEEVAPEDFSDGRLGDIFRGLGVMAETREPIDYLSVSLKLGEWDVRGVDLMQLSAWVDGTPSVANATYYARVVREGAVRRSLKGVAARMAEHADGSVSEALTSAIEELTVIRDGSGAARTQLKMLREVLAVPENEDLYDWVVPGLLEVRDRMMLTGSEGGGKSTLLRQIVLLAAAGLHPFTFQRIEPVRVLVVDVENSEKQWRRAVREVAATAAERGVRDPQDSIALACTSRMDLTRAADVGRVHRLMDQAKPDLLLIGPLYRLIPRAIQSDDDAAPLLAALDGLRERDVAMLIEAHAGHTTSAAGDRDLRPRGSSALLGWPEFGLGLRRAKEQGSYGQKFQIVRWRGDRDAREWPPNLMRGKGQMWPWEPTYGV